MRGVGSAPRSLRQGDTQNLLPFYNAPIFEQDFPFSSFFFCNFQNTHTYAETYFDFSQKIMVEGKILSNLELEY